MIDALRLVSGAVSTKDLIPVLTHIALHEKRVTAFDGHIAISSPVEELAGLSLTVDAALFASALDACCDGATTYTQGEGELRIASGKFRAVLETLPAESFPFPTLVDFRDPVKGGLLPVLRLLRPFVGQDAVRMWACGIQLKNGKAWATNNIIIAQAKLPVHYLHEIVLPIYAVDQLLRIGEEPLAVGITDNAATFYLPDGVWLHTNLITDQWPASALELVDTLHAEATLAPLPEGLSTAVARVAPFCADKKAPVIQLHDDTVRAPAPRGGAEVSGFAGLGKCSFRVEPLQTMLAVATEADWTKFPRVPWVGSGVSGVVVGVRG